MVPLEASDVAQIQEAQTKAPATIVIRQAQQPLRNLIVLDAALSFVPMVVTTLGG